jgi:adenosylcobinamide-phosphate synthase
VGNLVGRDTENLSESEVIRATVESVAENTVDGSLSPILYACVGGATLAWLFKAASTLDSMVGYRNKQYYYFGWASARLDDLLNWVPARLAHLLIPIGASLVGLRGWNALQVSLRNGQKHPSPNAGISESAFAGALAVQLGGPVTYNGVRNDKPLLGSPGQPLCPHHITESVRIMWMTSFITLLSGMAFSYLLFKKMNWLTYPVGIHF